MPLLLAGHDLARLGQERHRLELVALVGEGFRACDLEAVPNPDKGPSKKEQVYAAIEELCRSGAPGGAGSSGLSKGRRP